MPNAFRTTTTTKIKARILQAILKEMGESHTLVLMGFPHCRGRKVLAASEASAASGVASGVGSGAQGSRTQCSMRRAQQHISSSWARLARLIYLFFLLCILDHLVNIYNLATIKSGLLCVCCMVEDHALSSIVWAGHSIHNCCPASDQASNESASTCRRHLPLCINKSHVCIHVVRYSFYRISIFH